MIYYLFITFITLYELINHNTLKAYKAIQSLASMECFFRNKSAWGRGCQRESGRGRREVGGTSQDRMESFIRSLAHQELLFVMSFFRRTEHTLCLLDPMYYFAIHQERERWKALLNTEQHYAHSRSWFTQEELAWRSQRQVLA